MTKRNRINRAEFLIFKYVEDLLMEIRVLDTQNLDEFTNLPSHNLCRKELSVLFWKMFESGDLVAHKKDRGYFSPTIEEIENALNESSEFSQRLENTFYGYISSASERYSELKKLWEEAINNVKKEKPHKNSQ